ncbi:MAG: NADPH:quinone reductase [Piscinibacter sp.]|nr:NADPH:quinone reductase [Piscinibacter sp.]
MQAALYRRRGPARDVLQVEDQPTPEPGEGELRVRLAWSGVNPSDVKSRAGLSNPAMDFEAVIPHSDGAGVVDAVGPGVDPVRLGERVWVFNGQWGRAHGTAAQQIVLPARQVVTLPAEASLEVGASIGIPLMTAWHAVASCGSLLGRTVLVPGAAGAVGQYVVQLARRAGARVIASVSSEAKAAFARERGADATVDYRREDLAARVRALTGGRGADVIIDVDAAAHAARYGDLLAFGGRVVVYGSGAPTIGVPFRPLIVGFATLYFFIVYRLPDEALRDTTRGIGELLAAQALQHPVPRVFELQDIAAAHEAVEQGADGKVLVRL